ncbi:MAG: hypothetical protein QM500_21845 [Methylococcales bacterium]
MKKINRKSSGYPTTNLLSDNLPDKPANYRPNINLATSLESIVASLGYDLRMTAPSHSIGHFTHPEWGYRLYNQYKAEGQVLALLNQCLGILNQATKIENLQANITNNIRGAQKANIYKQFLYDAVGSDRFNEIKETLKLSHPELFNNDLNKRTIP